MDQIVVLSVIIMVIIFAVYGLIFFIQYCRCVAGTERLVALNTRTAFFLPFYAICMFIAACQPDALPALNIPITFMEGYSFYCFFALTVTNLGGPAKAVNAFKSSGKELVCCSSWCPTDHVLYYKRTVWALFHFVVTRTLLALFAAIATYSGTAAGKAVTAIISVINVILLVYALLHIVLFYENVYKHCSNLFGLVKMVLLKMSVGLIVLQGLIVQFMVVTKAEPYDDDSDWDAEQKTQRGYAALVLIEFIILCVPYFLAWCYKITVNPESSALSSSSTETAPYTLGSYFFAVAKFWDVFGTLTYREELTAV